MLYLKEGTFETDPANKILKAEDYSAYLKVHEVIALAKKKAEGIVKDAKTAYENEKQRGYEEGMEAGNQKISELMIESAARSVKNFEEFENDVIEVVGDALKKILGEFDNRELISRVVKNALATVRNQKKVTVIVNPTDSDFVHERVNELLALYPAINTIDVLSDARVQAGGCKIETEMGVVDATLDTQLEAIRKSLTKVIK